MHLGQLVGTQSLVPEERSPTPGSLPEEAPPKDGTPGCPAPAMALLIREVRGLGRHWTASRGGPAMAWDGEGLRLRGKTHPATSCVCRL